MVAEQTETVSETNSQKLHAAQIARVAKALGHPARVSIVAFLMAREGCVAGDIVDEVGLAQSTVSEHLRILKAAGLITGAIEHPRICYSLNPEAIAPLHALLADMACCANPTVAACYDPAAERTPTKTKD